MYTSNAVIGLFVRSFVHSTHSICTMCGIAFILAANEVSQERIQAEREAIAEGVQNRGGNAYSEVDLPAINGIAIGSVLHMRGQEIIAQPVMSEDGDVLLWNGEIFGGIHVHEMKSGLIVDSTQNKRYGNFDGVVVRRTGYSDRGFNNSGTLGICISECSTFESFSLVET